MTFWHKLLKVISSKVKGRTNYGGYLYEFEVDVRTSKLLTSESKRINKYAHSGTSLTIICSSSWSEHFYIHYTLYQRLQLRKNKLIFDFQLLLLNIQNVRLTNLSLNKLLLWFFCQWTENCKRRGRRLHTDEMTTAHRLENATLPIIKK